MSDIYRGALFTIAATAAADPTRGLFYKTGPQHQGTEISALTSPKIWKETYIRKPLHHATDPTHRSLTRRGWVFQGMVLSPRVLHFDSQELLWECAHGMACECRHGASLTSELVTMRRMFHPDHLRTLPKFKIFQKWHRTVQKYSLLKLSKEDDILPAISGIAKRLLPILGSEYVAGLWQNNLIEDLCWSTGPDRSNRAKRPVRYRAPTFSWASVVTTNVGIKFYMHSHFHRVFEDQRRTYASFKVIDTWCQLVGADTTGQVSNGYIDLQGALMEGNPVTPLDDFDLWDIAHLSSTSTPTERHYHRFDADYDYNTPGHDHISVGDTLYTMALVHATGRTRHWGEAVASLSPVLRRCKDQSDLEDGLPVDKAPAPTFERVGFYREVANNSLSLYAKGNVRKDTVVRIV
jgi:hypothetical protein